MQIKKYQHSKKVKAFYMGDSLSIRKGNYYTRLNPPKKKWTFIH